MFRHLITTQHLGHATRWSCSCGAMGGWRDDSNQESFDRAVDSVHNLESGGRGRVPAESVRWAHHVAGPDK